MGATSTRRDRSPSAIANAVDSTAVRGRSARSTANQLIPLAINSTATPATKMTTVICPIVASTVVRGRATATDARGTPAWERASTGKATTRQDVEAVTEENMV